MCCVDLIVLALINLTCVLLKPNRTIPISDVDGYRLYISQKCFFFYCFWFGVGMCFKKASVNCLPNKSIFLDFRFFNFSSLYVKDLFKNSPTKFFIRTFVKVLHE